MYHSIQQFQKILLLLPFLLLFSASVRGDDAANQEEALVAILSSDAPLQEKAIACKKLAIFGTEKAVPELAKLLPDPKMSSWARIALEAIPAEASSKALREAAESVQGRQLVGVLNSIGVRRDAEAVEILASQLTAEDSQVASAAAVALGLVGNVQATASLQKALTTSKDDVLNAVADGYVLCAEKLHKSGDSEAAAKIYNELRTADLAKQRIVEATRGAILAGGANGIELLVETLRSDDKKLFQVALGTARVLPGSDVDKQLAQELAETTPERAALIVQLMSDRTETVDLAAVLKAAQQGDIRVRLSALDALQRVGDVSCLKDLFGIASDSEVQLAEAAKATLAALPGEEVDGKIAELLQSSDPQNYQLLLELVGMRRIDAVKDLLKALNHVDASVRAAALTSLGETIQLNQLSVLIDQVIEPKNATDGPVAAKALRAASVRMPDQDACSTQLEAAVGQAKNPETQTLLLEIVSEVGGTKALAALATAAKSGDEQLLDTSSRLLGKWNGVEAAPVLLDLSKTAADKKYQIRALRGYIGIARKFSMPPKQRADMCQQAMDTAIRPEEQKLVLDVLKIHPSVPGLKLAVSAGKIAAVKSEANAASQAIADNLRKKGVDVSKILP
ncbi:MAG: HEAT repeat domain-containing protein [Planctomycetota bacterium]